MISDTPLTITNALTGANCFDYVSSNGTFFAWSAKTGRVGMSRSCREEWSRDWRRAPYIGFTRTSLNIKLFNQAWAAIERKLGLTELTVIYPVIRDHRDGERRLDPSTVILGLSPFWTLTSTHRAFMTLFIRMAGAFYTGRFRDAVQAYGLAQLIAEPIDWFLAGNTHPTYANIDYGIVDKFRYAGMERVKTMLVKPEAASAERAPAPALVTT